MGQATTTQVPTERVASHYRFERTDGRGRLLAAFDRVLEELAGRAEEHHARGNDDLLNLSANIAQEVVHSVERLCRKWEESDERGLIY